MPTEDGAGELMTESMAGGMLAAVVMKLCDPKSSVVPREEGLDTVDPIELCMLA